MAAIQVFAVAAALALGGWQGGWQGGWPGALLAFICLLALYGVAAFILFRFALARKKKISVFNPNPARYSPAQALERFWQIDEKYRLQFEAWGLEEVHTQSADGLRLHGYFIRGTPGETRTMVLLHGYAGIAQQMNVWASYFRQQYGLNILMPNARAHGKSEGKYIGMGWPERHDCLLWLALLKDKLSPHAKAGVYGVSMGGATATMLSGEALPNTVAFIAEDCGYTSVWDEFAHQLSTYYGLPAFPLLHLSSLFCRLRLGYGYRTASALRQVQKAKVPMLFIHGEKDRYVPYRMALPLYKACASTDKTYISVPGAHHGDAWQTDKTKTIQQELHRLIETYMPPH